MPLDLSSFLDEKLFLENRNQFLGKWLLTLWWFVLLVSSYIIIINYLLTFNNIVNKMNLAGNATIPGNATILSMVGSVKHGALECLSSQGC